MGRDLTSVASTTSQQISIHSPRMGRDFSASFQQVCGKNFNPLSPHGERPLTAPFVRCKNEISIHSPRMGRDHNNIVCFLSSDDFNPLSPHGERHILQKVFHVFTQFQSTLPAWGETNKVEYISDNTTISIHSPRMGRDMRLVHRGFPVCISIHSPRMGRDIQRLALFNETIRNFNPLSPHGERLYDC